MLAPIIALSALIAAASPAIPVSVASGDWSNIPYAQQRGSLRVSTRTIEKFEAALMGECNAAAANGRLELTVPFLIRFGRDGSVQQVVVRRLDCPSAESLVGGAILQMARSGEFRPTGENLTGWYRGQFSLDSRQR